jgi:hypothetical protein
MELNEGAAGGEGAGAAAGFGGAADLLGGAVAAAGAGGAAASGEGAGAEGGAAGAAAGEGGAADAEWLAGLSAETEGDKASLRDWAKAAGVKDLNGLAKIARDNQAALRDSGRVKIPGDGASAEEVSAWRSAIGVPETVEGYSLPQLQAEDGTVVPLDKGLIGALLPKALERGVPSALMNGLVEDFVQLQLDAVAKDDADQKSAAQAWVTQQGDQASAKLAAVDAAGRALGLQREEMIALRGALGSGRALDILSKLGEGMAEDVMITGGQGRFSVTGREAQAEINQMIAKGKTDRSYALKVRTAGTPENERWNRLQGQAGAWAAQQESAA